ncbi:MAG: radical SAM family heme chaperone HemW [Prevotella sp.]
MAGLYVHIPFCKTRCVYCGFYSTTMSDMASDYIDAVCAELDLRRDYLLNHREPIETVYIGGGTPSVLEIGHLERLVTAIDAYCHYVNDGVGEDGCQIKEFTVECNPEDISEELVEHLHSMGVNRISMGVQTFDDKRLKFLNRRHSSLTARKSIDMILDGGIENISIDLMYGFPDQTLRDWEVDINTMLHSPVKHVSAYMLHYEEGTALWRMLQQNKVSELNDTVCSEMYYLLKERLEDSGFLQYEISNFSKKHYRSKHNSSYWEGIPYIGVGAAAHSYNTDCRQWNVENLISYIEALKQRKLSFFDTEPLTRKDKYNEMVMLRLRTMDGLNMQALAAGFGEVYSSYCMQQASRYIASHHLALQDGVLRLTKEALFISDMVIRDLFML